MALKTTHALGDPIKAADMNSQASAIIQNEHNILQLFLENFFASKVTAFLGLFFDGFSDTSKADINTNTTINTTEKRLDLDDTFTSGVHESIVTSFQQSMATVKLWVVRKFNALPVTASIDLESTSNQFLSITDVAQTGLDITGDMTFECWFNAESFLAGGRLTSKDDAVNQRSYGFVVSAANKLNFDNSANGTDANDKAITFTLTTPLVVGEWNHIAIVYNAAGTDVDFFVNGVPAIGSKSGTINSSSFNGAAAFVIGKIDGGANNIDGKIDEVRMWNDKRTAGEILANFDKVLVGNEAGLVGYWKFENDLLDTTANNNDLTNNNGAIFSTDTPPQLAGNIDKQNLKAGISAGATSLDVDGDQTGVYAIGDTIDISTPDNLKRERKVLTNVVFSVDTTLSFSATTNAFTVSDFVERVNVLPSISLVNIGNAKSFSTPTYVRSELGTGLALSGMETDEVEDEYEITFSPAEEDLKLKLDLSRIDTDLPVYAKRLGTSLNT